MKIERDHSCTRTFATQENTLRGFDGLGLKETISVTCWYLWWLIRCRTHNETIPSPFQCKISILMIIANAAKAAKPQVLNEVQVWTRPAEPRQVKLNVDVSPICC
jgi:hypothetical protein